MTATPSRDKLGLPDDALVLASLVPHWKITQPVFDVWMRVLGAIPDAGALAGRRRDRGATQSQGRGGSARHRADRLVWARKVSMAEFIGQLPAADLFVDTFPYGGHSTTSGALFAGLPIVTLAGRSFASRVAGSVLRTAGLDALVAHSLAEYEALIRALGRDRAALASLRADVARARAAAPLFDLDGLRARLEQGYRTVWQRWRSGEPSCDVTVPPGPAGRSLG
ncbi:MAG: hypothetical protein WDO24_31160 [Pseudomonadota bacterium]